VSASARVKMKLPLKPREPGSQNASLDEPADVMVSVDGAARGFHRSGGSAHLDKPPSVASESPFNSHVVEARIGQEPFRLAPQFHGADTLRWDRHRDGGVPVVGSISECGEAFEGDTDQADGFPPR
jgi:hypothetical protein